MTGIALKTTNLIRSAPYEVKAHAASQRVRFAFMPFPEPTLVILRMSTHHSSRVCVKPQHRQIGLPLPIPISIGEIRRLHSLRSWGVSLARNPVLDLIATALRSAFGLLGLLAGSDWERVVICSPHPYCGAVTPRSFAVRGVGGRRSFAVLSSTHYHSRSRHGLLRTNCSKLLLLPLQH